MRGRDIFCADEKSAIHQYAKKADKKTKRQNSHKGIVAFCLLWRVFSCEKHGFVYIM